MISHSALDSIVIFLGPIRVDNCNPRRYSMHVLQPVQWKYIRFFCLCRSPEPALLLFRVRNLAESRDADICSWSLLIWDTSVTLFGP
jgi:hypothetical protein